MVKKSKKLLSVLLSVLMAVSCFALPFSINAADAVAYEDENSVTGYVTTDPIIYVHGTNAPSIQSESGEQYNYMMYGSVIADGSFDGECKTSISSEKEITSVTAVGVDGANVSISGGVLTGDLGDSYKDVKTYDSDSTVTLKFTFSDGTYEYHKYPVKTNPVATHVAANNFIQSWSWENRQKAVAMLVLANGSYGDLSKSGASYSFNSTNSKQKEKNGYNNFAKMYSPYSTTFDAWCGNNWDISIDSMSVANGTFDKTAGYYAAGSFGNKDGHRGIEIISPVANYYLDLSSGKNYGVTHTAGTNEYSVGIITTGLYWNGDYNGSKTTASSSASTSVVSGSTGTASNASLTPSQLKFDSNTSGTTTISGTASVGVVNASFAEEYYSSKVSSTESSAKVTTQIRLTVTNKDAGGERTAYNNCIVEKLKASDYTPDTWKTYQEALLNMEEWLNDNIDTSSGSALKTALDNAKNGLLERATDLSAFNAVRNIITSSTFDSSVYTAEAQQKINEVLSSMNACLDSNGNALISVSQNYVNSLVTEALTYITVKDKNDNPNTNLQNQKFTLTVDSVVDGNVSTASKSYAFGKVANINDVFDLSSYLNDLYTVSCTVSAGFSNGANDVVIDLNKFDKTFFMQQDITVTLDIKSKAAGVIIIQNYDGSVITSYTGTSELTSDGSILTVNGSEISPVANPTYVFTKWVKIDNHDGTLTYKQVGSRISQVNNITVIDGSLSNTPESLNAGYTISYTGSDSFLAWVKTVNGTTYVDSYQSTDLVRYTSKEDSVVYKAITSANIDSSDLSSDVVNAIKAKAPATYSTGYVANGKFVISGEFTNTGIDTSKYTITSVGVVISKTNTEPTKGGSACAAFEVKNYSSSGTFTASVNSSVSTLYGRTYVAYTENVDGVGEVTRIAYGPVCTINK